MLSRISQNSKVQELSASEQLKASASLSFIGQSSIGSSDKYQGPECMRGICECLKSFIDWIKKIFCCCGKTEEKPKEPIYLSREQITKGFNEAQYFLGNEQQTFYGASHSAGHSNDIAMLFISDLFQIVVHNPYVSYLDKFIAEWEKANRKVESLQIKCCFIGESTDEFVIKLTTFSLSTQGIESPQPESATFKKTDVRGIHHYLNTFYPEHVKDLIKIGDGPVPAVKLNKGK